MKKFAAIVILAAGVVFAQSAGAQETWTIDTFASDIVVQPDGIVAVTETIQVDFKNLQKHGIFRDLPYVYRNTDGTQLYTSITDIAVTQDGAPAITEVTRNNANLRIRIGDPGATITGPHTYVISYDVTGVLRSYGDYDELYWNVTGNEWEVPVTSARATVHIPASIAQRACYQGPPGSREPCTGEEQIDGAVVFTATQLALGEGLTVAVGFAPGVVPIRTAAPPPTLANVLRVPATLSSAALVVLVGAGYVLRRWLQEGRDRFWPRALLPGERSDRDGLTVAERVLPLGHRQAVSVEYEPPDGLRPAEAGVLMDERAHPLDISATIVDLASRGYLAITEVPKTWFLGKAEYEFAKTEKDTGELLVYEKALLDGLFRSGTSVRMSQLKNSFYKRLPGIKSKLYHEVVRKKLFPANPEKVRAWNFGVSGVSVAVGIAVVAVAYKLAAQVGAIGLHHSLLAGIGGGISIAAVVGLLVAYHMPRRTGYGRELYQRLLGYKLFVSGTERYRAKFYEDQGLFEKVLPYAIVFGVTDQLARAFKEMQIEPPQPSWLHSAAVFNAAIFVSDMNTFSHSLSTTMASSPSGSGSGGGGSVGGGGGGGGGGSW